MEKKDPYNNRIQKLEYNHNSVQVKSCDAAHNQTSKTDAKGTTSYTYDNLNRLKTVTEPGGKVTTYTYDKAGNRATETITQGGGTTITTYNYNEQNRLTGTATTQNGQTIQTVSYTYDNNGNQLVQTATPYIDGVAQTAQVTTNTYDELNRLTSTTTGGTTITNTYNGDGLRVAKTVNGNTTNYLYEYDKVILELDDSNNEKARNVYGTNLIKRTVDGETYHYMYNGHGDVTALLDAEGNISAAYYYDAFGNITETVGEAVYNPYTYAGYRYDWESGLYYLNARYYDPRIARFLSEDTYRGDPNDPLSLNLYTYCDNEPIMYIDPTGHWKEGDEKLTDGAKMQILDLTAAWFAATTPEEKKKIEDQADAIRNNPDNHAKKSTSTCSVHDDIVKIEKDIADKMEDDGWITPDEWAVINPGAKYSVEGDEKLAEASRIELAKLGMRMAFAFDELDRVRYSEKANDIRAQTIDRTIILNYTKGAMGFGHNANLLINSAGQGFFFSYYPTEQNLKSVAGVPGEMRMKVMTPTEVNRFLYYDGRIDKVRVSGDDSRREDEMYNRFIYIDTTYDEGKSMYNLGKEIFKDPEKYYLIGYSCTNVTKKILEAGGKDFSAGIEPNAAFEGSIYAYNYYSFWEIKKPGVISRELPYISPY